MDQARANGLRQIGLSRSVVESNQFTLTTPLLRFQVALKIFALAFQPVIIVLICANKPFKKQILKDGLGASSFEAILVNPVLANGPQVGFNLKNPK